MTHRLKAEMSSLRFPKDVHVGDIVTINAEARVSGIQEDLIDVTQMGGDPQVTPGQAEVTLFLTKAEIRKK